MFLRSIPDTELVYCTWENSSHGSLVGSTACSPSLRHFSPPFRAVSTQIHVTGTLCHFGSKDLQQLQAEFFFFPPLKLGESNHFVFHVGIKSKIASQQIFSRLQAEERIRLERREQHWLCHGSNVWLEHITQILFWNLPPIKLWHIYPFLGALWVLIR